MLGIKIKVGGTIGYETYQYSAMEAVASHELKTTTFVMDQETSCYTDIYELDGSKFTRIVWYERTML